MSQGKDAIQAANSGHAARQSARPFGASAPRKAIVKKFGFMPEHVVAAAREQLAPAAASRR